MLRRHIQTLALALFASAGLAVPNAEADNITLLDSGDNIFCTDDSGTSTSCSKSIQFSPPTNLVDGTNVNFELNATVVQGTWTVSVTAIDQDGLPVGGDTHSFETISTSGTYWLAFDQYSEIDFSQITKIEIEFQNSSAPGDSISVVHFAAVPEPGTAGMLMLGLLGLAVGSPRKSVAA